LYKLKRNAQILYVFRPVQNMLKSVISNYWAIAAFISGLTAFCRRVFASDLLAKRTDYKLGILWRSLLSRDGEFPRAKQSLKQTFVFHISCFILALAVRLLISNIVVYTWVFNRMLTIGTLLCWKGNNNEDCLLLAHRLLF